MAQIIQFLTLFLFINLKNYPVGVRTLLASQGIFTLDVIPQLFNIIPSYYNKQLKGFPLQTQFKYYPSI